MLDFRNEADDIVKAFEPYYGEPWHPRPTRTCSTTPARRLDDWDVLRAEEIEAAVAVLVTMTGPKDHGLFYGTLSPGVERFRALGDDDQAEFKDALDKFVRTYSFLSQVVSFGDTKLERDYRYCRALASVIRAPADDGGIDLGSEVELTALQIEVDLHRQALARVRERRSDGHLRRGQGHAHRGSTGTPVQDHRNPERTVRAEPFRDRPVAVRPVRGRLGCDQELAAQARNNTIDNFRLVFDPKFMATIVRRMDMNEAIFKQILSHDTEFRDTLAEFYLRKIYKRLRQGDS